MIWIIGFVIIVVLIFAISSSSSEVANAQAKAELGRRMDSRIAAYRDFIRREGNNAEWEKMTDNELDDVIANTMGKMSEEIKNLRGTRDTIFWVIFPVVTFAPMYFVDGVIDNNILLGGCVIAGLAIAFITSRFFLHQSANSIEKKFEDEGWDVDKLIV